MNDLQEGDFVQVIPRRGGIANKLVGKTGRVVVSLQSYDEELIGVCFDAQIGGNNLNGKCPDGEGHFCKASELTKLLPLKTIVKEELVRFGY